ncbi:WD40/YVTN repeat-like-containing domain superfamily [Sesbania bispinosa]|nr:WD40/YVTN repeat-like-containing domain superfamily [Sesbania bispinosa]
MISAISWIPKGVSKSQPVVADPPSKEDIEELITTVDASGQSENEDEVVVDADGDEVAQALTVADAIGKSSTEACDDITLALKDLNMENYDDEDEGVELFSSGIGDLYYPSNDMDPFIKDKNDDDSEELEDMIINPTDSVIVCARNEDDVSVLEVWILEDANSSEMNMYIHHDIIIPAFPLCTAWLDCPLKGGERGNFLAVGSMEPSIEIWDLDVIDEVQPCVVLGGKAEKKKKGKKKSIKYKDDSHTDSVLGLAWNKEYRNILASASADKRVKIWDVVAGKCDITMEHHSDKVQAVAWNHHAPQVLLSGSFDHTVVLKDGRMPSHSGYKWSVTADVESLAWDPHTEHYFVVSLEDGIVKCFDVRTAKSDSTSELNSTFTLHAHDEAVTSVSYNPLAPNLLATGSMDKTVKLWDLSNNQPSCVASKTPRVGALFSISFSNDNPFLLAIGGSKGKLQVWDTLSDSGISRRFENYNKNRPQSGA